MTLRLSGGLTIPQGGIKMSSPEDIPTDPYWANVVMLVRGDGINGNANFTDLSPLTRAVTPAGAIATSMTESKFGVTGSFDFSTRSSANYLSIAYDATILNMLEGDYTIEGWLYPTHTNITCFFEANTGSSSSYNGACFLDSGTNLARVQNSGSSASTYLDVPGGYTGNLNEWQHVAFVRNGSEGYFFVNGVKTGTDASISGSVANRATGSLIGKGSTSTNSNAAFGGYIEEVRITQGIARYTGATFDVPTEPFPSTGP
jgi:hypothetical protein